MNDLSNRLIQRLPAKDRLALLAACEQVELTLSKALCEAGRPLRNVYFPTGSFISLIAAVEDYPGVEVGMVGSEGVLGAHIALGIPTAPLHAVVQGPGAAWRISAPAFAAQLRASPALDQCIRRYLYVLMAQLARSAACLRFHQIGPRLARWLLMSQDRAQTETFQMTQEFLAYMLGVRRVGITQAASDLQAGGLIVYKRGQLTVVDRPGLEAAACSCYAANEAAYAPLLALSPPRRTVSRPQP